MVGAATIAAALEARRRGVAVKTPLLLSNAIEAAAGGRAPAPAGDGADAVADVLAVVAGDKRAVVEERRAVARAATAAKVRHAARAAAAAARVGATPGELEDLGGAPAPAPDAPAPPSKEEIARLRAEVKLRLDQLNRSMLGARTGASEAEQQASHARGRGDEATAREHDRKAEAERAHMHALLGEMAQLERELAQLEEAATAAAGVHVPPRPDPGPTASPPPRGDPPRDPLADLKKQARRDKKAEQRTVDDELAALKRKMAEKKRR